MTPATEPYLYEVCPECGQQVPVQVTVMDVSGIFEGEYVLIGGDMSDWEAHQLAHE